MTNEQVWTPSDTEALREVGQFHGSPQNLLGRRAADEIDRLRGVLQEITVLNGEEARWAAERALKGEHEPSSAPAAAEDFQQGLAKDSESATAGAVPQEQLYRLRTLCTCSDYDGHVECPVHF